MKLKNTSLIAAAIMALASSVHAQTVIDIVGSTAGRSAVHTHILGLLAPGSTYAYFGNADASKATSVIYHGTYNSQPYTIRTFWAGSKNGIQDVSQQIQQSNLLAKTVIGTTTGQYIASGPTYAPQSTETVPEIGYSDVFATSTDAPPTTVEDEVAIIPFKWYRQKNGSTAVTNMTPGLVQQIYSSSEAPLALWSGLVADEGTVVYPIGRNDDSGTRITTLAESGFGVFNRVDQYITPTLVGTVPNQTFASVTPSGNTGFSSGSNVKAAMQASYNGPLTGATIIGYLGASDWLTAAESAQELTWNGVPYTVANLTSGKYTFWGYLHQNTMLDVDGSPADLQVVFYSALKGAIIGAPGSGLQPLNAMHVGRSSDGAPIYPLY